MTTDHLDLPMTSSDLRGILGYTRGARTHDEQVYRLAEALGWFGIEVAVEDHPALVQDDTFSILTRTLAEHEFDLSQTPELDRDEDGNPTGGYTMFCRCKHPIRPSSDPDVDELRDHQAQMLQAALLYGGARIDEALAAANVLVDEARSSRVDLQAVELAAFTVKQALRRPLLARTLNEGARIEAAARAAHAQLRWALGGSHVVDWELLGEEVRDGWREFARGVVVAHAAGSPVVVAP